MTPERNPTVLLLGTLDTKGKEYAYLRDRIRERGVDVLLVDAGILGEPCYPSLGAIPEETRKEIDFVAIFRRPEAAAQVAEEAARLGFDTVWLVPGSFSRPVEDVATARGLAYVPGVCLRTARELTLSR